MQNYGPHLFCDEGVTNVDVCYQSFDFGSPEKVKVMSVAFALFNKIVGGLKYLSPTNERKWIKTRRS